MRNGRMGLLSGAMSIASDCAKLLGAAEKSKILNYQEKKSEPLPRPLPAPVYLGLSDALVLSEQAQRHVLGPRSGGTTGAALGQGLGLS